MTGLPLTEEKTSPKRPAAAREGANVGSPGPGRAALPPCPLSLPGPSSPPVLPESPTLLLFVGHKGEEGGHPTGLSDNPISLPISSGPPPGQGGGLEPPGPRHSLPG